MFTRVSLLFKQSRCAEVIPAAQRTIVAQPNLISTSTFLGLCLMFDGRAAEAIPAYQHSIRLSPSRHPALHLRYRFVGYAQLFRGHYEEALVWFDKSLGANPSDNTRSLATTFAAIAAAQALSDEITKARVSGAYSDTAVADGHRPRLLPLPDRQPAPCRTGRAAAARPAARRHPRPCG